MTERPEDLIFDQSLRLIDRHWTLSGHHENESWPGGLWDAIAEAGFLDFLVPSGHGGIGATLAETAAFLKAAGSRAVALPLAETIIARGLMIRLGLPLPDGAARPVGLVIARPASSSPQRHAVTWARYAETLMVMSISDGKVSVRVAEKGAWKIIEPVFDLAGRPGDLIEFAQFEPRELDSSVISPAGLFAVLRAAQIAGAMERVLEIATIYAQERVQFGRPIGKFQAIQQMAAELAALVAASQVAVDAAATHPAHDILAWSAKARSSEACGRVAAIAHQMIGAIGYTQEFALRHFTRLLWAWRDDAGDENFWHAELAAAFLRNGDRQDFWAFVTDSESPSPYARDGASSHSEHIEAVDAFRARSVTTRGPPK